MGTSATVPTAGLCSMGPRPMSLSYNLYLIPCFKEVLSLQNPFALSVPRGPQEQGVLYGCNCAVRTQWGYCSQCKGALGMLRNHGLQGEARLTSLSSCFLTGPHREELVIGYSGRLQEQVEIYRDQTHTHTVHSSNYTTTL